MAEKQDLERYLPYVRRIASRVFRRVEPPLELDDLVSYGMLGLAEALDRYRPEDGIPFEAFAHYRVRGAILEGISRGCPVSRHVHRRLRLEQRATDYMEGLSRDVRPGTQRTAPGDAALVTTAVKDLASIYTVARMTLSKADRGRGEEIEDPGAVRATETQAQNTELWRFVEKLPEQQRELIRLYYFEDLTLLEVGQKLGFRKSWACKLHQAAIEKLRVMMAARSRDDQD